jgi:hypothetical protein
MRNKLFGFGIAAALALAAPAHASGGVKVGTLSCHVAGGWGLVLGSTRGLSCTFSGSGDRVERYGGTFSRFGLDLGYRQAGVMVWTVFAPGPDIGPGALAGHYGGATAAATVGVGVGANALLGGSGNNFALQPLSIEGSTGVNVAAGVAGMRLWAARS